MWLIIINGDLRRQRNNLKLFLDSKMNSTVKNLIEQVPPPEINFCPDSEDWQKVENSIGLILPSDYKNIIEIYGDYYWADFLHLLNPFSKNKFLNLITQIELINNAESETRTEYPEFYPFSLYPEVNGLLPFFITDNGDIGFWITYLQPENWSILIKDARSPEFEVHFFSVAMFLYQFSGGRFQSIALPHLK